MDVASSFAVSVAPPSFQKEVEEARRDTQNRVSIPKAAEMSSSSAQTHIADKRGNTEGENSLLAAQQHGVLDAEDELTILPDGRRQRRKKKKKEENQEQEGAQDQSGQGDADGEKSDYHFADEELNDKEKEHLQAMTVQSGFDPVTGYYEIPATRKHKRRSILLRFKEQNVHFLERFSDRSTAVGLINFALRRRYGSIIPHSKRGQVVERLA